MKILRTKDGGLVLNFTSEEADQIFTPDLFENEQPDELWFNLREKTIDFFKELKEHFGTDYIERNQPVVKEIIHKHYVSSLSGALRDFERRGGCKINWTEAGRIKGFTLTF